MAVMFTTPEVGRVFLACRDCGRVKPHWELYPDLGQTGEPRCRYCGGLFYRPTRISEVTAAWWVLVVGWLWRKHIRKSAQWDPRLPVRTA